MNKRIHQFSVLIALLIASAAGAQVSPDEAAAKLRERDAARRAAATQPSTLSNAQVAELNQRIATLTAENQKLKSQVDDLAAKLARATSTANPAVPMGIAAAIKEHKIVKGMTLEQAEKAMNWGDPGPKIERAESMREGQKRISWDIMTNSIGGARVLLLRTQVAFFKDGIVVDSTDNRFHYSDVGGNAIFPGIND